MGIRERRLQVPINEIMHEMHRKLSDKYGVSGAVICKLALETGLRQIAVPSGAPVGVALPAGEGF